MAGGKVLVQDASRVARLMMRSAIADRHPEWQVDEVSSVAEVLRLAVEGGVRLVVLGDDFPEVNHAESVQRLRERMPKVRMVWITSKTGGDVVRQADELGVELLHKPITEDKLRTAVSP